MRALQLEELAENLPPGTVRLFALSVIEARRVTPSNGVALLAIGWTRPIKQSHVLKGGMSIYQEQEPPVALPCGGLARGLVSDLPAFHCMLRGSALLGN